LSSVPLANRWEKVHLAVGQAVDDLRLSHSPIPSPAPLWPGESDLDYGFENDFGL
jgi:hypothetical protein